jgi:hypothetical protein
MQENRTKREGILEKNRWICSKKAPNSKLYRRSQEKGWWNKEKGWRNEKEPKITRWRSKYLIIK